MDEPYHEWKEKLDQTEERFRLGISQNAEGWQAIAYALMDDLDKRIAALTDLKYSFQYAILFDNEELHRQTLADLFDLIEQKIKA